MDTAPDKECDLIMKGGIASGIVYPQAVLALKEAGYRFRCLGGTSAGAIAATAAAAAEYGRATGGFEKLAALNKHLCGEHFLRGLFQPTVETRALLEVASAALRGENDRPKAVRVMQKVLRVIWAFVRWTPLALFGGAAAGVLAGKLLACLMGVGAEGVGHGLFLGASGLAGASVAVTGTLLRQLLKCVPGNGFGICTGHAAVPNPDAPALTDWLISEIEGIGGKPDGAGPLTFGDLERRGIRLRMMTTNVSQELPFVLPFDKNEFLFCEREMAQFFPATIVEHLIAKSHKTARVTPPPGFHFLPPPADLPIVVAMRLSLSFPVLLSAVPLYTLNFERSRAGRELDKNWFSDGGLCSNFSIHFFDTWLPVRPTFGITLAAGDGGAAVSLPRAGEIVPKTCHALTDLVGFLGALVSTMQNYRDNLQAQMPSYRERIVQVRLKKNEGGLNLDMPAATLLDVAQKGADAGRALAQEFRMDAHQWTRFQVLMSQLEAELKQMDAHLRSRRFDFEALAQAQTGPHFPYARSRQWCRRAARVLRGLRALVDDWPDDVFQGGCPRPPSELRLAPCLARLDGEEAPSRQAGGGG